MTPSLVRADDRLFLIDRLIAVAFRDDEVLDAHAAEVLLCVQHITCGSFYEAPPDLGEFLQKHFPKSDDLLWTFVTLATRIEDHDVLDQDT